MKKIINGKRYDTDTAERVACWESDASCSDFHWYEEDLYRKKTGEFFLRGNGNGLSPYTRSCGGNSWCGDERLVPLTIEEAKEWVEGKANCLYEELFGVVEE